MSSTQKKKALLFGSTGLIGGSLLIELLETNDYEKVVAFVRKPLDILHPKLVQVITDFDELDKVASKIEGDDLFICLGTTMAKAGSKEAFFKVDFTYSYLISKIALENHVSQMSIVSSMGADSDSLFYYSKVKGLLEDELLKMPFNACHIFRPSLLLGDRKESRLGEYLFTLFSKVLPFIFFGPLKKYRPIKAEVVSKAMLHVAQSSSIGNHIYQSEEFKKLILKS